MEPGIPQRLLSAGPARGLTAQAGAWLLGAADLPTLARRVVDLASGDLPGSHVQALWWEADAVLRTAPLAEPPGPVPAAALEVALASAEGWHRSPDGLTALVLSTPGQSEHGLGIALLHRGPTATAELVHWAASARGHVDAILAGFGLKAEVARLRREERLHQALFAIADVIGSKLDKPATVGELQRIVRELTGADGFGIALYDPAADTVRFPCTGHEGSGYDPRVPVPMEQLHDSLAWHLIRGGRALRGRADRLPGQVGGPLRLPGPAGAEWLGVPVRHEGSVRGAVFVHRIAARRGYTEADEAALACVGAHVLTGLEHKRAQADLAERTRELNEQIAQRQQVQRRLEHEVLHDPLTGLPNRAYLREQVGRALARRSREPEFRFAMLVMDLDRFKVVNDSAGHPVGDALLVEVARRFQHCMRASDILARLGGDEFAILMDHIESSEAPARLAQRLLASLERPFQVGDKELFTSAGIGIVLSEARYLDPDEILRDADIAMYRAKAKDSERFELFDELLHEQAMELLDLEGALRRAIAQREFEPYFQPIVRLDSGEIVGYEALLRWNRPQRGVMAPGAFLRVAEVSGLLETIDWLMFEHTCALIPRLVTGAQYVNINFSPRHFRSDQVDQRLLALLRSHDVRPSQVRIEVTEGTLMDNPERVGETIDRLHRAGVYTALDDFGTGYSSLGYLHRFRLHTVKIDRSFVSDLEPGVESPASAVAEAVMALSRSLGLEVVAEGIETATQRDALKALGCRLGQGYLFARPQPLPPPQDGRR